MATFRRRAGRCGGAEEPESRAALRRTTSDAAVAAFDALIGGGGGAASPKRRRVQEPVEVDDHTLAPIFRRSKGGATAPAKRQKAPTQAGGKGAKSKAQPRMCRPRRAVAAGRAPTPAALV